MQFNPLGIALVQYVYTLYMHVWFCLCKVYFIWKRSDSLLTMGQFPVTVFCDALYCRFFSFSWGIISCA